MKEEALHSNVRLALDTIHQQETGGIPSWLVHVMEHDQIEKLAGVPPGSYLSDPENTYLQMQINAGVCLLDQWLWNNPLSMGKEGFIGGGHGATTGADTIVVDGLTIDSPEAVVQHLEHTALPSLREKIEQIDIEERTRRIIETERRIQDRLGPTVLKSGHGFIAFPTFSYGTYGYTHYFSAFALYPDVMERHFSLQADLAVLNNQAAAKAYREARLPPLYRLDHDMADSRGLLVRPEVLDRIWLPHFARSLQPLLAEGVKMLWHCDGNLMELVPRLLEAGVAGFQGFQYECGMDYARICRMKTRSGDSLIIIAGSSVTTTLPFGSPSQVRDEMKHLVQEGPRTGLFLGASSSVIPGTPWENVRTMVEGLQYYRMKGRNGQ